MTLIRQAAAEILDALSVSLDARAAIEAAAVAAFLLFLAMVSP